ncbi:transmembrane protein, putative, partial (macronuclear) [Tetrahymena thermophila SB210]
NLIQKIDQIKKHSIPKNIQRVIIKNMSLENQQAQKDQQNQDSNEEKKLLSSLNDVQIVNQQQEQDSSKLDQSIDVGQSVDQGVRNENGYQEVIGSETSLYDPQNKLNINQEEKKAERTCFFSRFKNFVKKIFCRSNCKRIEDKFSQNQLIFSIFLRGGAAYYMIKKRQVLMKRLEKSLADEKTLINISSNLSKTPKLYFDNSSVGQSTLMQGTFTSRHIKTKIPINIGQQGYDYSKITDSSSAPSIRKVILQTDKFENQAVPIPLQSKENLITSAFAGLTYYLSSNIFQVKFKLDDLNYLNNTFYFFGKKNSNNIMDVEKVFLKIDWLKIKSDQRALKLCALLASSIAVFFTYKAIVSTVVLAKKKKSFFSKLLQEIKEYFQL